MNMPMLAVDNDIEVSLREQAEWERFGVSTVRVGSMQEAVDRLSRESFLFTAINADNITFMPLLKMMREIAPSPIFVITSDFKIEEQVEAILNGADVYAPFQENAEEHILLALAVLQRYHERSGQPKGPPHMTYDKLLISPAFRQVFCYDMEVRLTKTEFDILCYLLDNRGYVLTYSQIYGEIRGLGYDDATHNALWTHMASLRKKLAAGAGNNGYIENVRDVGYRLPVIKNG